MSDSDSGDGDTSPPPAETTGESSDPAPEAAGSGSDEPAVDGETPPADAPGDEDAPEDGPDAQPSDEPTAAADADAPSEASHTEGESEEPGEADAAPTADSPPKEGETTGESEEPGETAAAAAAAASDSSPTEGESSGESPDPKAGEGEESVKEGDGEGEPKKPKRRRRGRGKKRGRGRRRGGRKGRRGKKTGGAGDAKPDTEAKPETEAAPADADGEVAVESVVVEAAAAGDVTPAADAGATETAEEPGETDSAPAEPEARPEEPSPYDVSREQLRQIIVDLKALESSARVAADGGGDGPGDVEEEEGEVSKEVPVAVVASDIEFDAPLAEYGGVEGLAEKLKTDVRTGLGSDDSELEFAARMRFFDDNTIPGIPRPRYSKILLDKIRDPVLVCFMFVALAALLVGIIVPGIKEIASDSEKVHGALPWYLGFLEGLSILTAVVVVVLVSTINDYQKEWRFWRLARKGTKYQVIVVRDGTAQSVPSHLLFPGDVVTLGPGDRVPADGVVIYSHELRVDESGLTGETASVGKSEKKPLLVSGSSVMMGTGRMLVVASGLNSEMGRTMRGVQKKSKTPVPTALEAKLKRIEIIVTVVAFIVTVVAFFALILGLILLKSVEGSWTMNFTAPQECTNTSVVKTPQLLESLDNCGAVGEDLLQITDFVILAVTILVVVIPEGLPLALTIALAFSVRLMLKDNNLVRKLPACETMGNCTTICSDKTGTLTFNQMRVTDLWAGGNSHIREEVDSPGVELPKKADLNAELHKLIVEGVSVNTTACLLEEEAPEEAGEVAEIVADHRKVLGSRTEGALLLMVRDLEGDYLESRQAYEHAKKIVNRFTFTSESKRMSTVIRQDDNCRLYCKGAAEIVLRRCTQFLNEDGLVRPIGEAYREELDGIVLHLSKMGLRVITLAYRDLTEDESTSDPAKWDREDFEKDLIAYAFTGIEDPIRPDVRRAVEDCRNAGIVVRMVTGDNLHTAESIARRCGILDDEGGVCIEADEWVKKRREERLDTVANLRVLARSQPEHKERLVCLLQEKLECVAVTGDGTNDAQALIAADVGLSMGISGTSVAKASSDIIILDDDFSTIVRAVVWGRTVFDNIRKFLQFQLTVSVVTCALLILTAITRFIPNKDDRGEAVINHLPFTSVQLLWVNLIMDSLAAVALSSETPVRENVLSRKPRRRYEPFISLKMWISILVMGGFQFIVLVFVYYIGTYINEFQVLTYGDFRNARWEPSLLRFLPDVDSYGTRPLVKNTMVFNTFVLLQLFNQICCRRVSLEWNIFENILKNWLFVVVWFAVLLIQIFIVHIGSWQVGYVIFGTTGLEWFQWVFCIFFALLTFGAHYIKTAICRLCYATFEDRLLAVRSFRDAERELRFRKNEEERERVAREAAEKKRARGQKGWQLAKLAVFGRKGADETPGDAELKEVDSDGFVVDGDSSGDGDGDGGEEAAIELADPSFQKPESSTDWAGKTRPVTEDADLAVQKKSGDAGDDAKPDEPAKPADLPDEDAADSKPDEAPEKEGEGEDAAKSTTGAAKMPSRRRSRRKSRRRTKKKGEGAGGWLLDVHTLKDKPGDVVEGVVVGED